MTDAMPNHVLQRIPIPNRAYALEFMNQQFYNILSSVRQAPRKFWAELER